MARQTDHLENDYDDIKSIAELLHNLQFLQID